MSSNELLCVARSIRKAEEPQIFNEVVAELARRNIPADFDSLGRGERVQRSTEPTVAIRQATAAKRLLKMFAVEVVLVALLVGLLVMVIVRS